MGSQLILSSSAIDLFNTPKMNSKTKIELVRSQKMKRSIMFIIFFSLVSIRVSAQTYGLDNADPSVFSKFRIPETNLSSLWFNTNLNFTSDKNSLYGNGDDNFSSNLNCSLAPQYLLLRESDDRYFLLYASGNGSYSRIREIAFTTFSPTDYYITTTDKSNISANEIYRIYPNHEGMFYSVSSNDQFSDYDQYNDQRNYDSTRSTVYSGEKTQNYVVSLGIGWGKMRNVTSVVSALRFQERLKQLNLLNGDLSQKTIEDLAEQFYRQGYFSSVHVRSDKYFWSDVEKTLSNDGVSLANLNQYADSYIREVPGELRFSRNEGIVTGLNIQIDYTNNYYSPSTIREQLYLMGNAYVNYSHQLDLNSQASFDLSFSGGPNLVENSAVKQEYVLSANAGYDYELTDRIVVSSFDLFGLTFQNMGFQGRDLSNSLNLQLNYFVEDNLSLAVSYSWDYNDYKNRYGFPHQTQTDNDIQIGFTYYLERGFLYR